MRKKIGAILLAVALVAIPVLDAAPAKAFDEAAMKEEKNRLQQELDDVRSKVGELENKNSDLHEQLDGLQSQGKAMKDEYDKLSTEMDNASKVMDQAIQNSQDAIKDVEKQQKAYEDRLVNLFQFRNKGTLEVLLDSDSIEGFFTNMRLMEYVAEADHQLLDSLRMAQENAKVQQEEAEKTVNEYEVFIDQKQEQLDKLNDGISLVQQDIDKNQKAIAQGQQKADEIGVFITEVDSQLADFYAKQEAMRKAHEESIRKSQEEAAAKASAEKASREASKSAAESASKSAAESASVSASIEASIAASEAASKAAAGESVEPTTATTAAPTDPPTTTTEEETTTEAPQNSEPSRGGLLCPLASYQYISSPYGPRVHPITGDVNGFHYGVDFSAAFGTPVRAAKDGTVVIASHKYQGQMYTSSKSGYGNYITIDHGDGTSTTYAHLMYVEVSEGQHVSRGERIGQVGSTGASTGSHLHFEYAIYGQTTNPLDYIG